MCVYNEGFKEQGQVPCMNSCRCWQNPWCQAAGGVRQHDEKAAVSYFHSPKALFLSQPSIPKTCTFK